MSPKAMKKPVILEAYTLKMTGGDFFVVEKRRLELPTPAMRMRCSPN